MAVLSPSPTSESTSTSVPPPTTDDEPTADEQAALSRMFKRMNTRAPSSRPTTGTSGSEEQEGSEIASDEDEVWEDAAEDLKDGSGDDWSIDRLRSAISKATALKTHANSEFSPGNSYHQAITTYLSSLAHLPPRPPSAVGKGKGRDWNGKAEEEEVMIEEVDEEEAERIERGVSAEEEEKARLGEECRVMRAVVWSNIAAGYLKLTQNKEAVEACTEALADDPQHVKALLRRSTANTSINTWSSLVSAQDDLKLVLPLLSLDSPLRPHVQTQLRQLPTRISEKAELEKGEMMGKLKDLGNSLLGNFGLSTDNFKFEPNGQGGYGMSFVR